MILPTIPITVGAERGTRYGDYLYYEKYFDHIEITDCDTKAVSVDIPAEIDGLPVTKIGDVAFAYCESLTNVKIPDSVTGIGYFAFYDCSSLTSVTIGSGVTRISFCMFQNCSSLTSITIGSGVTSIENYAFSGCVSLTNVTIPNGITSIGDSAFDKCRSLTSVVIPNSVKSVGNNAFRDCSGLTSITIGSGVTSMGKSYGTVFDGCGSLNITVDESNIYYSDMDGVLFNDDKTEIIEYAKDKIQPEYIIPSSVKRIGEYVFRSCSGLTNVTIPDSVTSIKRRTFVGCGSLNISVSQGNQNYSDIDGVLFNKDKTEIIEYTKDKIQSEYSIPDSVTSIGSYAFEDCTDLKSVIIPNGVTSIGDWAFHSCSGLTGVIIPDSITRIGDQAFGYCGSLNITVDEGNLSYSDIDGVLFNKDKTEIIEYTKDNIQYEYSIPDSVTSIRRYAFEDCTGLKSVIIPNGVTIIGSSAFDNCTGLTSITIPNSVMSIDNCAFQNCTGLKSIMIGNGLTSIGDSAFNICDSLTDVYYAGSEEQWRNITIESDNSSLRMAHMHYNSDGHPRIEVSEPIVEGDSITITAETKSIDGEGELFAVGYDGSKLTASEKLQDGAATLPAEDVQTIKVFCWDSLDTMRPLCEPKTITIK